MTWDATNLYVGIVNANLREAAVIYIARQSAEPTYLLLQRRWKSDGFNYDDTDFSSLPFRAKFVTYVKDGYREYRNSDGNGGWTVVDRQLRQLRQQRQQPEHPRSCDPLERHHRRRNSRRTFVFFGYLTSSGGYVYGQAPSDNNIGSASSEPAPLHTQYYAVTEYRKRHQHAAVLARAAGRFQRRRQGRLLPQHFRSLLSRSGRRSARKHARSPCASARCTPAAFGA